MKNCSNCGTPEGKEILLDFEFNRRNNKHNGEIYTFCLGCLEAFNKMSKKDLKQTIKELIDTRMENEKNDF